MTTTEHPDSTEGVTRDVIPRPGSKAGSVPAINPAIHPNAPLSPERVATRDREVQALNMRRGGASSTEIAHALGLYDYQSANRILHRAMDRLIAEPAEAVRRLEGDRLDRLQRAIWPKAMDENNRHQHLAIDRCLAIMERRARLLGLDAPLRIRQETIGEEDLERAIKEMTAEAERLEEARRALDAQEPADIVDAEVVDDPLDHPQPDDPLPPKHLG